jgi:DNA-binding LacI/PurR family transcriptional regulator
VDLLLRRIAGEPVPDEPVRLPVELIVRESCGSGQPPSTPPARTGVEAG